MKKILLSAILVAIISTSCTINKPKVVKCTSQIWQIKSSNISGNNYHIVLKVKTDTNKLKFDSILIGHETIKTFNLSVIGKSNNYTNFIKNDLILISFNLNDTAQTTKKEEIFYRLNKKKCFVTINNKIKLKPILN